MTKPEQGTL